MQLNISLKAHILGTTLFISGCSIYPIDPEKSDADVIKEGANNAIAVRTIDDAINLVNGWEEIFSTEARNRRKYNIALGEEIFLGSILAAAGTARESLGKAKTGAVAAAVGGLLVGRYKFNEQALAFEKAARQLQCFQDEALLGLSMPGTDSKAAIQQLINGSISSNNQNAAIELTAVSIQMTNTTTAEAQELISQYVSLPSTIKRNVEQVRDRLRISLSGIALANYNSDQITAAYDTIAKNKTASGDLQVTTRTDPSLSGNTASVIEVKTFLLALKDAEAKMIACSSQYPQ